MALHLLEAEPSVWRTYSLADTASTKMFSSCALNLNLGNKLISHGMSFIDTFVIVIPFIFWWRNTLLSNYLVENRPINKGTVCQSAWYYLFIYYVPGTVFVIERYLLYAHYRTLWKGRKDWNIWLQCAAPVVEIHTFALGAHRKDPEILVISFIMWWYFLLKRWIQMLPVQDVQQVVSLLIC